MKKINLWHPVERPSFVFYNGSVLEVGHTLAAGEVYCDLCNIEVPLDPAPMVDGYVLCLDCLVKVVPEWEEQVEESIKSIWRTQTAHQKSKFYD